MAFSHPPANRDSQLDEEALLIPWLPLRTKMDGIRTFAANTVIFVFISVFLALSVSEVLVSGRDEAVSLIGADTVLFRDDYS